MMDATVDMSEHSAQPVETNPVETGKKYAREYGPGFIGSAFLHALGLFLILFFLAKAGSTPQQPATPYLPVDIVQLGDRTEAPQAPQKSAIPQQKAARIPVPQSASPHPPVDVAPSKKTPPTDDVEAKLRGLAQLREPDAPLLAPNNAEIANTNSTNGAAGDEATYSLRDFVRAQVERRWSLNLEALGKRNFSILVRIEMTRKGTITLAEIVDKQRFKTDAVYRDIAISARNAVILSSPIVLPEGHYREMMDMVLDLNPRDTLR